MRSFTVLVLATLVAAPAAAQTRGMAAPDSRVIAVVLGEKITAKDKDRLTGLIVGPLLQQFARDNKIAPTDEELDTFARKTEEKERQHRIALEKSRRALVAELKDATLSERARKDKESRLKAIESVLKTLREMDARGNGIEEQRRQINRRIAHRFVMRWKVHKALYARYGGRVIFQQAGPEPLDAYRDFLRDQEKASAFRIVDKAYEAPFWRYFTNDAMHRFYKEGEGARFIETPWWMMEGGAER